MNFKSVQVSTIIKVLTGALLISACNKNNYVQQGDSVPEAFKKSMALFQNEEYSEAADGFEIVFRLGRGTEYAQEAQFYLAESYFNNGNFLMAASEYERYISLYPRAKRRQEVQYKEALCYYKLSPRYRLDQKHSRTAIEKFNLYLDRYPDSEYVTEINEYIQELQSKLARKLYSAADLYMRIDEYESAIIYYDLTFNQYPGTQWAEVALVDQINAYIVYADNSVQSVQQERYQKAVESYERYLQMFPNGEHRQLADEYVDEARVALAQLEDSSDSSSDNNSASAATASTSSTN